MPLLAKTASDRKEITTQTPGAEQGTQHPSKLVGGDISGCTRVEQKEAEKKVEEEHITWKSSVRSRKGWLLDPPHMTFEIIFRMFRHRLTTYYYQVFLQTFVSAR